MENKKTVGNVNPTEKMERNPSFKKKTAPQVRQTLTSYNRMLRANPLLKYKEAGINIDELIPLKSRTNGLKIGTSSVVPDSKTNSVTKNGVFKKPDKNRLMKQCVKDLNTINNGIELGLKKSTVKCEKLLPSNCKQYNVEVKQIKTNISSTKIENKVSVIAAKSKFAASMVSKSSYSKASSNSKKNTKPPSKDILKTKTFELRRSLSSGHLQSKKCGKAFNPKIAITKSNSSRSEENLSTLATCANVAGFSPILEEHNSGRDFVFKTPSAYERRSICHFTPKSLKRRSLFQTSTPAVNQQTLEERLNLWLKLTGKELTSYHHLRCFGIEHHATKTTSSQNDEENKENIEALQEKLCKYEEVKTEEINEQTETVLPFKGDDLENISKEALIELRKLIQEEFPREQCLSWLELIREKYVKVVEEPEYWECRAAIEQSVGNIGNAVEYYKTAIIRGAEVNTVDKSLDQLLKKFSLLNISPNRSEQKMADKDKERIIRDARNVFKSSIIQFAVQERKFMKKTKDEASNSQKKIVRPVRRSTRLSRSGYVSTPGVQLCMSLKEIEISTEEYDFEKNQALC